LVFLQLCDGERKERREGSICPLAATSALRRREEHKKKKKEDWPLFHPPAKLALVRVPRPI